MKLLIQPDGTVLGMEFVSATSLELAKHNDAVIIDIETMTRTHWENGEEVCNDIIVVGVKPGQHPYVGFDAGTWPKGAELRID